MIIFAIDPGTRESAAVFYDTATRRVTTPSFGPNEQLFRGLLVSEADIGGRVEDIVVCEMPQYYGKDRSVGMEVLETCVWVGRFMAAVHVRNGRFERLSPPTIRGQICGTTRSGDREVRQALIDRFGGDSVALKGKKCPSSNHRYSRLSPDVCFNVACKKCDGSGWLRKPGPLAGITSHMWAALAVAVTWAELHPEVSDGG